MDEKGLGETWEEWRKYIIISIKKLNEQVEKLKENTADCKLEYTREITKVKTAAGIWGVIGGAIITCIFSVISGVSVYYFTTSYVEKKSIQMERAVHIDQYEQYKIFEQEFRKKYNIGE